jgi:PAS domain S-box-containing protein
MGNAKAHVLLATGPDEATAAVVNDASSSYATALRAHSLDEALRLYESGTLAFAIVDAEVGWADRLLERCYAPGQDAVVPILLLCDAEFLARYGPSFPLPQGADCLHKPVHPALLDLKIRNMLATYRQQQVLKDQHDQWETALAAADLASWEWDVVQDRITWSSQLAARQGVRVEDAPQTIADFLKIVHPDDVGRVKQTIEGALVRGDRYACEMRILNSDGSIRHVLATGHVRCDRTGRPVRLIGIERDVTAERDVEQALRASEQRFRAVQQSTPDGFMIFRSLRDPSGQIVDFIWEFVNPAAEKIVQRTEVSLLGKRLLEEMPGNREEGLFDAFVQVVETGRSWQREFHYQHEAVDAWFRSTASKAGDGFAVSFADITAFRRGQTALHESEERLRLALQAGSTGVWERDFRHPAGSVRGHARCIHGAGPPRRSRDAS